MVVIKMNRHFRNGSAVHKEPLQLFDKKCFSQQLIWTYTNFHKMQLYIRNRTVSLIQFQTVQNQDGTTLLRGTMICQKTYFHGHNR